MEVQPTKAARAVFEHAVEEVRARGEESVRAEHLLLGVLAGQTGVASAALDAAGVSREEVSAAAAQTLPAGMDRPRQREYPYDPTGARILERVFAGLADRAVPRVTSGDVLSALIEVDGPARHVLEGSGPALDRLRRALQQNGEEPD